MIWSTTKKKIAASTTISTTIPVEIAVSRRVGQVKRPGDRRDAGEDRYRRAPVHHVAGDQVSAAEEEQ